LSPTSLIAVATAGVIPVAIAITVIIAVTIFVVAVARLPPLPLPLLVLRRRQTRCLMHDNVSLDNQLKVRELITLSRFYCLLLTCSVLLAIPALLGILATPSCLSFVGLGVLN
jgi:hypothetical protein